MRPRLSMYAAQRAGFTTSSPRRGPHRPPTAWQSCSTIGDGGERVSRPPRRFEAIDLVLHTPASQAAASYRIRRPSSSIHLLDRSLLAVRSLVTFALLR